MVRTTYYYYYYYVRNRPRTVQQRMFAHYVMCTVTTNGIRAYGSERVKFEFPLQNEAR